MLHDLVFVGNIQTLRPLQDCIGDRFSIVGSAEPVPRTANVPKIKLCGRAAADSQVELTGPGNSSRPHKAGREKDRCRRLVSYQDGKRSRVVVSVTVVQGDHRRVLGKTLSARHGLDHPGKRQHSVAPAQESDLPLKLGRRKVGPFSIRPVIVHNGVIHQDQHLTPVIVPRETYSP